MIMRYVDTYFDTCTVTQQLAMHLIIHIPHTALCIGIVLYTSAR